MEIQHYQAPITGKVKSSKRQSVPGGKALATSNSKENFPDIFSFKTKSMDSNLDKIGGGGGVMNENRQKYNNKTLTRGQTFCIKSDQIGFRFKTKAKTAQESDMTFLGINLVRQTPKVRLLALNTLLSALTPDSSSLPEKSQKLITKYLGHLRVSVCGDKREKVLSDKEYNALIETMVKCGFISNIVMKVAYFGFEERKVACLIFCNLFRRPVSEGPVVTYIENNPKLLLCLLDGYRNQSVALTTGRMLRECIRYESLASAILYSDFFYEIFEFLKTSTFEVSSDAFVTLQDLLLGNKKMTAEYLKTHYDQFFTNFDTLLTCSNYVTQVTSLKFLGSILMDRRLYDVMRQYVEDAANLKRIILLMSSSTTGRNIQLEGFHIFKIFLANPAPSPPVRTIFRKNKERLISLLTIIEGDKYGEQFGDEKAFLIKQLRDVDKDGGSIGSSTSASTDVTHQSDY